MVADDLSLCLSACEELYYEQYQIKCELFDEFRKTAWLILSDPQCEWSPQAEAIRRKLWRLIRDLCHTPKSWTGKLSENLGYEDCSLVEIVISNFGLEQESAAAQLVNTWDSLVSGSNGIGHIRLLMSEQIKSLRDTLSDFRILATKGQQSVFQAILDELGLDGSDVFCTASNLKRQPPFDALVTCGPFREFDFLFTAPRYEKILNVRWGSDRDFKGFPEYLTNRNRTDDESQFSMEFPVKVVESVVAKDFDFNLQFAEKITTEWSYDDFEQIYVPRKRRRNRLNKQRGIGSDEVEPGISAYRKRDSKYTQLVFFNGATLLLPFDPQNKPQLMLSIDPESDTEVRKRRPYESVVEESESEEQYLKPGMLVVIEPQPSVGLADAASDASQIDVVHLPRWKRKVREKLEALKEANLSIKFAMQLVGLDKEYPDIQSRVRWWCKYDPNATNSPGKIDVFKKLVSDFAGYDKWEAAWEEVNSIWNESISVGLTRESNIDKYLIASVKKKIDEILSSPQTLLDVKGFASEVIVIELSEIVFLNESQVRKSEIGRVVGLNIE